MKSFAFVLSLVLSIAFGESSCESSVCEEADTVEPVSLLQVGFALSEQKENENIKEVETLGENASLQAADCQNAKKCDDTGVQCKPCTDPLCLLGNQKCKNCDTGSRCDKQKWDGSQKNGPGKCLCVPHTAVLGGAGCLPQEDYHNRGYCRGFSACWDRTTLSMVKCRNCPQGAVREGWTGDSYPYQCTPNPAQSENPPQCLCCDQGEMNFPTDGVWGCKEA